MRLDDFEGLARERLDRGEFDYIAGGAADELTLADNVRAWRRWRLRPRVLVGTAEVDTSTHLLGAPVAMPVAIAPVAFQHIAHPAAEIGSARAAARRRTLFCLSTMSSCSLEAVASAATQAGDGPRWFQLYVHEDRGRSADLVRRAEAAGYSAIVVTVDFPVAGRRERDHRNRFPYPTSFGNFAIPTPAETASPVPAIGAFNDASLSWSDLAWLRGLSSLPLVIKGILTAEDARLGVENGAAGIVVSNHGGRQLDRAVASAEALPEVVDAVAGRAEIYVDGGIRRGADVLTALAMGARGVLVGRPIAFALATAGENGVARSLDLLTAEISTDMALLGITRLEQLTPNHIRRAGG